MPSLPNRPREGLLAWVDALQRRHVVLGFPFAVIRKYGDDGGWRHAALITYYGFLSVFPILLVAASLLSAVPENRRPTMPRASGSPEEGIAASAVFTVL